MDISDNLSALKSAATEQLPLLDSKKKRENALLLRLFATLGYNPFNIREVEPEFSIGLDEGGERRVDYVTKKDGSPVILFQVEEPRTNLDACDPSPLLQVLKKSEVRVGALTDGVEYCFYADLESFYAVLKGGTTAARDPFLTFNLLDYSDSEVKQLRRLTKPEFAADEILSFAHRLKYIRLFREYLQRQRENPDEAFVRFMMEQVHGGKAPKGDTGMYEYSVREALRQLMGDGDKVHDQASLREETKEEKTERGVGQGKAVLDKEDVDSESNGKTSVDQNFEEFFRERLGR